MDEKNEHSIYLDDRGLEDGTFLKSVVKEAIEHEKLKKTEKDNNKK